MGREIRMVPPNWEHPKKERYDYRTGQVVQDYQPLYDRDYATEAREWMDDAIAWDNGTHEDLKDDPELKGKFPFFWEWSSGHPDPAYYRPAWKEEEATWFQVYETVSEGTPVTPPFATKEELVDYLVEHGDFWDQSRGHGGWDRKNAEQFVGRGHAFSMMVTSGPDGNTIKMPRDGQP